ncbi:uncharacterized protein BCR38DRAFT_461976 [Pseudomassariella vexata]|uniref:Small nuclear ribonucleoprotein Prp3 C-terminal domain-containing protein n=1 Tax=Pseudomassariella vexata TaxID=1141098 RepID=A0A1Y2D877_9PEZI|nr:uncharacterized protein BCR38DRAFT_461976 [Pseudomassariella vexata]ORY55461.1 hypothetical protein BCR38DRAFT_461976 [Pseudomassariella vexata]
MQKYDRSWEILLKDLMELQLGQINLLLAMYPDSATVEDTSRPMLDELEEWCNNTLTHTPSVSPSVSMLLNLALSDGSQEPAPAHSLHLDLSVPLAYRVEDSGPPSEPPNTKVRIQQPAWMSKAEASRLAAEIPEDEDLFAIIEHIKDAVTKHIESSQTLQEAASLASEPLIRVWFYFPSISTRAKRDDLINHAPGYGLTGFLLAGKPGLLCLEGGSNAIDDYMKFIKTESWGDIPAAQKKVSERYRQTGTGVKRTFPDMQEITDHVGERRGERANRGDMKALESWLGARGLGEAFAKVIM